MVLLRKNIFEALRLYVIELNMFFAFIIFNLKPEGKKYDNCYSDFVNYIA